MHEIVSWREPAPFPALPGGQLHLWWLEFGAEKVTEAADVLSSGELARARRMRDGGRFTFFRAALRRILAGYLDREPSALVLGYGPHGKPRVQAPDSPLGFNLAHCGDRALLAVMDGEQVGVDLERLRSVPHDLRIARRQFGPEVAAELEALPESERQRLFLRHWTAMEACIKCRGAGVFDRSRAPCSPVSFIPVAGWMAAVASSAPIPPVQAWDALTFSAPPG
ncbi:MAG: 4'-phosphopantetheinyl transferase superfamily protein [Chromatiales bacterium]|jgi:4'-phosphopantetheinyl transferase